MNWTYKAKWIRSINDFPPDTYGFVYEIAYECGHLYIGKKNLWQLRTLRKLKSGNERKGHDMFFRARYKGHLVEYERVKQESDWKTYCGSFKDKDQYVPKCKRILYLAKNSLELTYLEAKAQMENNAITDDKYLNDNILGKFFRGRL